MERKYHFSWNPYWTTVFFFLNYYKAELNCFSCVHVCGVQFKTFSQRVEELEIDVYRSLDEVKAEPSEGSTFFRDCLIEWRVCLVSFVPSISLSLFPCPPNTKFSFLIVLSRAGIEYCWRFYFILYGNNALGTNITFGSIAQGINNLETSLKFTYESKAISGAYS